MKKLVMTAFAAALSLGALAFEKYMIRVPDELNPQEGIKGVTTYFFAPFPPTTAFAVSIASLISPPTGIEKSPLPPAQKIQPRLPFVPSLVGQVKPPSRASL